MLSTQNKKSLYSQCLTQLKHMFDPREYVLDEVGRMAIAAAVLKIHFPHWIFAGFYRCLGKELLVIGPYQGAIIACGSIPFDRGVCGAAARRKQTLIVDDVLTFPGYIACDDQTRSEIAVPVLKSGELSGILDIDAADPAAFDSFDQQYLEQITQLI